jgi:ABC-type amino acid transport substrate-binding protein
MGVTEERKQSVDFSNYYWSSDQGIMLMADSPFASAKSLADLSGAKVAAQLGSMWEAMVDQIPGVDKKESLPDVNTIITALKSGKIDATIMGETEAKSCMMSNPELAYVTFEEGKGFEVDLADCSAGIAVAKGNTVLLDKINAVVATIDREMQEKLMGEAFDEQPLSVG